MAAPKLASSLSPEDLALELGSTITHADGRVFNASGRMGSRLPKAAPQEVAPTPAPDNNAVLMQTLVDLVSRISSPQAQVAAPAAPEIHIPAPVVTVQPAQRVLEWSFTFDRNPDGTIKSIRAKAI